MAESKTERLLQVVLCLSQGLRSVTKEQLRQAIPDYSACPSAEAFERMFERDKNELRELGIPLETVGDGADDDAGYRIDRDAYALPPLELTRDETTAVALAASVWREAGPASAAARALLKLAADGAETGPEGLPRIEPRLSGGEAAFAPLIAAVDVRRPVEFAYRTSGQPTATLRHVHPWAVVSSRGRWYVVGHDTDRDAPRVFRLSRIDGAVTATGRPRAFEVPPDIDARAMVEPFADRAPTGRAVLRVRPGSGYGLRRRQLEPTQAERDSAEGAAAGAADDRGWDRIVVPFGNAWTIAAELASYGESVVVDEPPELRDAVVKQLRGVLA